jgi:hypothetical protein
MKHLIGLTVLFISVAGLATPLPAQPRLYPVPGDGGLGSMRVVSTLSQEGHSRFIAEKPQYTLRVGFPTETEGSYLPDTDGKVIVLWVRIENVSSRPMNLDITSFSAVDGEGKPCAKLSTDEAFDRLLSAKGRTRSLVSKATKGVSLGRAGGPSEEDARDEAHRFTLHTDEIPVQGVTQGLIFFEAPPQDKFTVRVSLGDLWSKPFVFTNTKGKK